MIYKKPRLAIISTYPFKKSGLSQYTKDLVESAIFKKSFQKIQAFSVILKTEQEETVNTIDFTDISSLISVAKILNASYDAVHIQFDEYYFYNNDLTEVNYLNFYTFLASLTIPTLVTLHFGFGKNWFFDKILRATLSLPHVHVTVHSENHMKYIQKIRKNDNKVHLIYHGFPDNIRTFSAGEKSRYKDFRAKNNNFVVLMTLGYFGEWKNQLHMIKLISFLIKKGVPIKYYVLGSNIYDKDYYQQCKQEIASHKMNKYIILKNIYLSRRQFNFYLKCADIYVALHQNHHNLNPSGTITYALGAGIPVIASITPFSSSPEIKKLILLAQNDNQFLEEIISLVSSHKKRKMISKNAINATASWTWSAVSKQYFELIYSMIYPNTALQKINKKLLIYPCIYNDKFVKNIQIINNANELTHNKICKKINELFQLLQLYVYLGIQTIWNKF